MKKHFKLIIVGGGASGMTAALTCSRELLKRTDSSDMAPRPFPVDLKDILVLEKKDQLGSKLLATGNGRCNLSNESMDLSCYRSEDPGRIKEILASWTPERTKAYFARLGITTRTIDGYIYPNSEQASAVRDLMEQAVLNAPGVCVITGAEVLSIHLNDPYDQETMSEDHHFNLKDALPQEIKRRSYRVNTSEGNFLADQVILATGGLAGPAFGCSGDGYRMALDLGHNLVKPLPALTALVSGAPFLKKISGVRCHAGIRLLIEGKEMASDAGQLQWTDYGISGVLVFQISRYAVRALADHQKNLFVLIDFLPNLEEEAIRKQMTDMASGFAKGWPRLSLTYLLEGFLHKKLVPVILREARLDQKSNTAKDLSDKEWQQLMDAIKSFPLRISGYKGYEKAQVTQGGIPMSQVDAGLQSHIHPGLYFAGEVLDVDGICGGYNLQWAWASGTAAGKAAAAGLDR